MQYGHDDKKPHINPTTVCCSQIFTKQLGIFSGRKYYQNESDEILKVFTLNFSCTNGFMAEKRGSTWLKTLILFYQQIG